ncbi:hypothetical protein CI102_9877 [Trichoderma harzianum]|uniref:HIT domain-containing protein n=1 Tax=Trichoderma harzianum CBS 226.95 TaxID=983964 RepID=A0A2T3ZXZ2_TRIHA|nr:hypothetical protein M431DRAFT_97307 [Trichoderma harzianum CBS 226.95]PKK45547.1 hypothetical protein CI102_9877 [Trichoderma harzianum]PTB49684.1 hypothetical protein M431DRAFT_97307 [Trichoderma harzianum CBS 226.95]
MLQKIKEVFRYLANLQWAEHFQKKCIFCNIKANEIIVENDLCIAINNITNAGEAHWLILPRSHIRDIENLSSEHLELLRSMDELKRLLLSRRPGLSPSEIHSGYHRGGRIFFGRFSFLRFRFPDTISVHHLHLHVIVRPQFLKKWFKYPPWLPLMWKSDEKLLREVEKLASKGMMIKRVY